MVEELLKKHNLKITKNRVKVINTIIELEDKSTIHNIINNTDIDKSTIYRILNILINNNILEKDINYDGEDYYVLKNNHKHYIKCVKCNKTIKLDKCPIDIININDFKIINHNLKIEGICKKCRES